LDVCIWGILRKISEGKINIEGGYDCQEMSLKKLSPRFGVDSHILAVKTVFKF